MASKIYSMTGFGRYERRIGGRYLTVEVRSVNNRYTEVGIRMPRWLSAYEADVRDTAKKTIDRGKLEVVVFCPDTEVPISHLVLNRSRAKEYIGALSDLRHELHLDSPVQLQDVLQFEDVFARQENETLREQYGTDLRIALKGALKELTASRLREGTHLAKDLAQRIGIIRKTLTRIQRTAKRRLPEAHKRLRARLAALLNGEERINPDRLELEVALLADRYDISEECVRLDSHLQLFLDTLAGNGNVGRKLDFVLQEMNREINTIGSKGNNFDLAHLVVTVKEEIERLREQARNLA